MQTLSRIRLLDFVADALEFRLSYLKAMVTATLNYEPMVFTPKQGDEAPLTAIQEEVLALKKERNALILAHNYQIDAIQRVADYVGDSLGLAYKAEQADTIASFSAASILWRKPPRSSILPSPYSSPRWTQAVRFRTPALPKSY